MSQTDHDPAAEVKAIRDLTSATLQIKDTFPGEKMIALPEGYDLSPITREDRTLESAKAFTNYVNRFAKPQTTVFFDIAERTANGIIELVRRRRDRSG